MITPDVICWTASDGLSIKLDSRVIRQVGAESFASSGLGTRSWTGPALFRNAGAREDKRPRRL